MARRITPWVLAAAAMVLFAPGASAELNLWISYYYQGGENYLDGEYQDTDTLIKEAESEQCCEPDEAHRLAATLDTAGRNYMSLEQYEESERYLKCALDLKVRELGPESTFVPKTLNNLGDLYYLMGNQEEAECRYRAALKLNETNQGSVEVCRSLNGLALIHNDRGEPVQAEELLKRAKDLHQRHLRRWHPYLAAVCINLAALYVNLERFEEAEPLLEQARFIQEQALPDVHPDVALRLQAEAAMCAKLEQYAEAKELKQKAEAMQAEVDKRNRLM